MSQPHGQDQPRLGATFYPGGSDNYYVPETTEVISPAPQRVMPEVPENMQDNLAHLEQEAHASLRTSSQSYQTSYNRPQFRDRSSTTASQGPGQGLPHSNSYGQSNHSAGSYPPNPSQDTMDSPNLSPFVVLQNLPPNVPPADEQKEANLEKARLPVLSSHDPEMQLAWAQDALSYVEVAMQNELRMSLVQPPRPQTPKGEHQLKVDAINITSFLAEQQHPKAVFIKGMWLEFGKFGFRVDKKDAFRCYARAAEKGYARAEYRMGMQFESSNEAAKAIRHYERGIALGDSASHYRLGMMILLGQHGRHQDFQLGLDYIRRAAQTCDENAPQGAYVYGLLLARELPQISVPDQYLPHDINGARINIEKAAYHGFAKAQAKMGAAYELSQLGCDFDPALSLHYNALAARQGEPEAEMAISKWFLCGHEGVFEKNDEIAFKYAQRAAQSGLPTAEFAMGYFYEVGICVPVDLKEARKWYSKAADSGNKDAMSRIDSISRSKTLSRKDHERVAIARIKSQYGSHGQGRSSHGSNPPPTIPEQTLEMPDPSKMRISDGDPVTHNPAPYPNSRDSPRPWNGDQPNHSSPEMRPTSAFGINPNIRPVASNYGNAPPNRIPSNGPAPMGYRQPSPGMHALAGSPHLGSANDPLNIPKVDIGFSAPLDPGRRRLQRPDHPGMPRQSSAPDLNHGIPPDRRPARLPNPRESPNASPGPYPPRGNSKPQTLVSPPASTPRTSGLPMEYPPQKPGPPGSQQRHAPPGPQQKPTSAGPSQNQAPTAAKPSAGGLPGKGPKTFEEMGIPASKNENDCVVM